MFCSNCGKEIDDKAVVCVHCGVQTNNKIKSESSGAGKSWVVTLLLCLFLGSVGAHRFYTKNIGSAVAQLLMTLTVFLWPISGIWAFIDLIIILCGNFTTKDGEELTK